MWRIMLNQDPVDQRFLNAIENVFWNKCLDTLRFGLLKHNERRVPWWL